MILPLLVPPFLTGYPRALFLVLSYFHFSFCHWVLFLESVVFRFISMQMTVKSTFL